SHPRSLFPSTIPRPPRSSLFPYTTLFRSADRSILRGRRGAWRHARREDPRADGGRRPGDRRARAGIRRAQRNELHADAARAGPRSEEHTSELQSRSDLVCRLLLEKKKKKV